MQVLGVFGFEVLDEGLFSLPRQLGGASIRFPLQSLLALLFVFLRVLVHTSYRTSVREHLKILRKLKRGGLGSD